MDQVAGRLHTLMAEKEGRIWFNIICFINLREVFGGVCLYWDFPCNLSWWKNIKKVMVSRNLRQAHLLEVGLTQIPVDHAPLSTTCHVGLHVDSSSRTFLRAFRPSPPSVKWTWTVSAFFTNESSYIAMVRAFSLVCEVAFNQLLVITA
jgi:hypothetical protein